MNLKLFPEVGGDDAASQEQTNGNWVKLHRSIIKWEWYDDVNTTRLFIHLILIANWKSLKWRGEVIERGQVLTSLDKLSSETKLSVRQIRTSLDKLKSTSELTIKATNRNRVITLCKYATYQKPEESTDKQIDKQPGKQMTSKRQASDKPSSKEGKERKNAYTQDFEEWWAIYRKGSKSSAFKRWKEQKQNFPEDIIEKTKQYLDYCQAVDRKVRDGEGWLNGQMWESDWTFQEPKTQQRLTFAEEAEQRKAQAKDESIANEWANAGPQGRNGRR